MQRIAVMGAGAVGCYFGGMLARAGADVTLIARGAHLDALVRDGLFLDTLQFKERVKVRASADASAVSGAELVLFSVKTTGTEDAARAMAPHLAPGARVVSLQNGVDNLEKIRAVSGIEAFGSVVYVAASIPEPGRVLHGGRGDLAIGDPRAKDVAAIAETFSRAGVPCRVRCRRWEPGAPLPRRSRTRGAGAAHSRHPDPGRAARTGRYPRCAARDRTLRS